VGKGAIMLAVMRGKLSEGMDFSDNFTRAVFIVGICNLPFKDPKIE
jgi:Rad3-related DNA helicase